MKSKVYPPILHATCTAFFVIAATLFSAGCDGDSDGDDSFSGPSGEGNGGLVVQNDTLEFLTALVTGTGFILEPIQLTNVNTMASVTTNGTIVSTNLVNSATTNAMNNVVANTYSETKEVGRYGSTSFNVPAGSYNVKISQVVRDPRESGVSFNGSTSVGEGQTATFTVTAVDENGISVTQ